MTESWRVCASFPDYEVSDLGRVRRATPGVNTFVGRILVGYKDINGYHCVLLQAVGGRKAAKVHRLVAAAFISPIPADKVINHKNGVKDDNRLDNLEIVSLSENQLHSFRVLGYKIHKIRAKGEAHGNSKLTAEIVRDIRRLCREGHRHADIAARYSVTKPYVSEIFRRKSWRHVPD